jgi:ribosome-binding protein aMBF1 (putative translation factor)
MANRLCYVTQDWEAVLSVAHVPHAPVGASEAATREAPIVQAVSWAPSRVAHTLRRRLVVARLLKLWTLEEAAGHVGLSVKTLRDLEAGRAIVAAVNLERIEKVLAVRLTPAI